MKIAKIKWMSLVLCTALIVPTSCDRDDEDDVLGTPPTPFNLEFTKTDQDQMGDFSDNAMAVFDDKVWSFGGINNYSGGDFTDGLWLSEDGMAWQSVYTGGTLTATGRRGHSLTTFGDRMYLIGGTDNSGTDLADIWATDDGTTWELLTADAPFGSFAYHKTAVLNSRLYIVGLKADRNMHVWSTDGTTWVQETDNAFSPRGAYAMVVYNNALCVIGGGLIDSESGTNQILRSGNGRNWTQLPVVNSRDSLQHLMWHSAVVYHDRVLVIGGQNSSGTHINNIYYSEDLIRWADFGTTNPMGIASPLEPISRHSSLIFQDPDSFWVFGGYRGSTGPTGKIWRFKEI